MKYLNNSFLKKFLILIFILPCISFSSQVNIFIENTNQSIETTCLNSTHEITSITTNTGISNMTTYCTEGCDTSACFDVQEKTDYLIPMLAGLLGCAALFFYFGKILNEDRSVLKNLFFFIGLILISVSFYESGIVMQSASGELGLAGITMLNIGYSLLLLFVLTFSIYALTIVIQPFLDIISKLRFYMRKGRYKK